MSSPCVLYYVHDPMCSWCWAFHAVWQRIQSRLPQGVAVRYILGGLAPDTDTLMSAELQETIKDHWQAIQRTVPGVEFNYDFWTQCRPRRSTYSACRAVIAARQQGNTYEALMVLAIQKAYYLQAKNPSDEDVLLTLATDMGLDVGRFHADLSGDSTQRQLTEEVVFSQALGVPGFPSSPVWF